MDKIIFKNGSSGKTPLNAKNLNQMQDNIERAIYNLNTFNLEIVTTLPTENIDNKTIYLILKEDGSDDNIYNEYIYINNVWELIGCTEIDVSKVTDTLPVGSVIEYEGNTIPDGYEKVEDNSLIVSTTEPTNGAKIWIRNGKNLFDYENAKYLLAYIDTNQQKIVETTEDVENRLSYIECKPNTTYTISKKAGKSFRIGTFTNEPVGGLAYNTTMANHTGTNITITTKANDKYLGFVAYSVPNGDAGGYMDMFSTVQVEYGSEVTDEGKYPKQIYILNSNDEYERFM